ncbi:hypothetical protein BOTCAL_0054g00360 [Botryotinia calthae]|uniref:Uncharacterized protein n=1 Tax=Botryotinia calthae TaxID=38488 RepID=A0A4Y8DAL7_9HELO|nr:hypothetical protein BOTCAL_0054g00360 [Botryotinia calthae]
MNSQDDHKNGTQIPTRFRIFIYALERGITQTAFMQAYNEILSHVEETENDLSPEMRQSTVEHRVWTKFFPNENSPPPLKFSVAKGFFDPPVSREAVEQYRIWQTSYLYSHQGQEGNSEQQHNHMQRGRNRRPIPDSMDDSTITPRIDNARASMPNPQSI